MLKSIFSSQLSPQHKFLFAIAVILAAGLAIILHEVSHGYAAMTQGDYTAKSAKRLTLNPLAHFDLFGFIMMMTIGIGWAKPVPVNPNNFKKLRKGIFVVSIAGVLANLVIAIVAFVLYVIFFDAIYSGLLVNDVISIFFYYFLNYCVILNAGLIAFNILPIYPLDGFRVIESFTKYNNKFCIFMRRYGTQIFLCLFLLGFVADFTGLYWIDILGNAISFIQNGIIDFITWFLGLIGVV